MYEDALVAQTAADTVAWLSRTDMLITAKQRLYVARMRELQLEEVLPRSERCPQRIARVRALARKQLDDVRELLELVRDTFEQMPPQLRRGSASRLGTGADLLSTSGTQALSAAVVFVDSLPNIPASDCTDGDCPVCLADLFPEDVEEHDDVVALGCGGGAHRFHRGCIRGWAAVSARCPLCREAFGEKFMSSAASSSVARSPSRPPLPQRLSPVGRRAADADDRHQQPSSHVVSACPWPVARLRPREQRACSEQPRRAASAQREEGTRDRGSFCLGVVGREVVAFSRSPGSAPAAARGSSGPALRPPRPPQTTRAARPQGIRS